MSNSQNRPSKLEKGYSQDLVEQTVVTYAKGGYVSDLVHDTFTSGVYGQ